MPHDLFLQWPVNYKHASFCRQTQGKAEIPRHLMFWPLDKRITVIFKLTVLQSYRVTVIFYSLLSPSRPRVTWVTSSPVFSSPFLLSFSLFLTIISSLFLSFLLFILPLLVSTVHACLLELFLVLSPAVCHWYSACLLVPFLVLSPSVCHWYTANE